MCLSLHMSDLYQKKIFLNFSFTKYILKSKPQIYPTQGGDESLIFMHLNEIGARPFSNLKKMP